MAEKPAKSEKQDAAPVTPVPTATPTVPVYITPQHAEVLARQQLAAEMAELKKNPLDRCRRPGGYFLAPDGTVVDGNGKPVPEDEI
jgi:hypothetical protein